MQTADQPTSLSRARARDHPDVDAPPKPAPVATAIGPSGPTEGPGDSAVRPNRREDPAGHAGYSLRHHRRPRHGPVCFGPLARVPSHARHRAQGRALSVLKFSFCSTCA